VPSVALFPHKRHNSGARDAETWVQVDLLTNIKCWTVAALDPSGCRVSLPASGCAHATPRHPSADSTTAGERAKGSRLLLSSRWYSSTRPVISLICLPRHVTSADGESLLLIQMSRSWTSFHGTWRVHVPPQFKSERTIAILSDTDHSRMTRTSRHVTPSWLWYCFFEREAVISQGTLLGHGRLLLYPHLVESLDACHGPRHPRRWS
jgi:hypothetical protein